MKTAFNLANFAVRGRLAPRRPALSPTRRRARARSTGWRPSRRRLAPTVLGAFSIAPVITLSGGAPQFEKLPEMIRFGSMVALANTSLALLAVAIIQRDPTLLWLLSCPLVIVFLAYRAYLSEREKHERLELLYQSSRILQHSPELDSSLVALLGHARTMFRAELAEVVLYPRNRERGALRTSSGTTASPT